jgi:hypothetical protein
MKVAVFGTRTLGDFEAVDRLILGLPIQDTMLLVDGKLGVSNYAKNKASFQMIPIKHFPANYKRDGVAADDIRNKRIIDESDQVYVFYNVLDEVIKTIIEYATEQDKLAGITEVPGQLFTEI